MNTNTEKPYIKDATWIIKVINSCKTEEQFKSAEKLIGILENKYLTTVGIDIMPVVGFLTGVLVTNMRFVLSK